MNVYTPTQNRIGSANEIAPHVGLVNGAALRRLFRLRKVPGLVIGHRQLLFDEARVREALNRYEVKEVK
jgi:hypothetical protein